MLRRLASRFSALALFIVLALWACPGEEQRRSSSQILPEDFAGRFLVFAEVVSTASYATCADGGQDSNGKCAHVTSPADEPTAYDETHQFSQNIFERIGTYAFASVGNGVTLRYDLFNARRNLPQRKGRTARDPNPDADGCVRYLNDLPQESDRIEVAGTWSIEDDRLRVVAGDTVHVWRQDPDDPTLFRADRPFESDRLGVPIISKTPGPRGSEPGGVTHYNHFGFAYLSDRASAPVDALSQAHLDGFFDGEIFLHNGHQSFFSGWEYRTTSLAPGRFEAVSPDQLVLRREGEAPGRMAQFEILLNQDPRSNLIVFRDFGNDKDENGCFDELGHAYVMRAIWDDATQQVSAFVGIEHSFQALGKPMLAVERYSIGG